MPPLLRALHENSIDAVQIVLEEDTHAATSLFWEHNVEPPLCTAVRLGCSPEVVGFYLSTKQMSMVLTFVAVPLLQFLLRALLKAVGKDPILVIPGGPLPKRML